MTGGALYNGGTTDKGGAVKLTGSAAANLTDVLISNCWTDKATFHQNDGGAIYMRDKATANLKDCTIRFCRAYDHGGFYQNNGKVYIEKVDFEGNHSEKNGGAFYSGTEDGLWLIGSNMTGNKAGALGGALYIDEKNVYMENCSVISNSAVKKGGGIYTDDDVEIGVGGKTVVRSNDGEGSMDNLVLEKGALIYDYGLDPGSEIHLRSDSDGNVKLGGNLMSEYQMKQYFRADYGKLELTDTQTVNTDLKASVFSGGFAALIIGDVIIIAALAVGIIYKKRQEGGATK